MLSRVGLIQEWSVKIENGVLPYDSQGTRNSSFDQNWVLHIEISAENKIIWKFHLFFQSFVWKTGGSRISGVYKKFIRRL